jgi:hypothetical protein
MFKGRKNLPFQHKTRPFEHIVRRTFVVFAPQLAYTPASCCSSMRLCRARAKGLGINCMAAAGCSNGLDNTLELYNFVKQVWMP